MKKTLCSIAAILCVGLLFSSCKKEVIHDGGDSQALTSLYTIEPSDWVSEGNGVFHNDNNGLDELTEDITDQGAVLIFIADNATDANALIYSGSSKFGVWDNEGEFFYDFTSDATDGSVRILAVGNTSSAPRPDFPLYIKVVSIPSSLIAQHPNVNTKDYNEVRRVFNLR